MVFNSLAFLVFIAAFLPIYFLLRGRTQILFALAGSYLFYAWWDYRFVVLIAFSTLTDYYLSLLIDGHHDPRRRKKWLVVSIVLNLVVLGFFKYFNFFIESANDFFGLTGSDAHFNALHIILPVGISFYTFQSMSYTIDVYRKVIPPERDLIRFATFISFFPQLVAGPIVRAVDFIPQLYSDKKFNWVDFQSGLGLVLVGFAKKVVIADSLAPFVDMVFANPGSQSSVTLVVGVVFYSFQIYCDFSGYSDIAIGLARIMGFRFPINFNLPYFSKSFSEFWERWHISLSGWLRDYLYISLGGNRKGKVKTYRNLMLTMLLGGLWHGANYTFIIWGFLHGAYLILQRIVTSAKKALGLTLSGPLNAAFSILIVYVLTCVAWIYFRSPDVETAHTVIRGIMDFGTASIAAIPNKFVVAKCLILISVLLFFEVLSTRVDLGEVVIASPAFRTISYAAILWLIAFAGSFIDSQFIYFQF